jgi:Fungal specific transcription factor domain
MALQFHCNSMLGLPTETEELRLFHQFRHCILPQFGEFGDASNWAFDILYVCGTSPAARQAAVALSAAHELHKSEENKQSSFNGLPSRAIRYYDKAISIVASRLSGGLEDQAMVEQVMVACLLFVYYELLRGNDVAAVAHLESGLNILCSCLSSWKVDLISRAFTTSPLLRTITKIFTRLDNTVTLFIGSRAPRLGSAIAAETDQQVSWDLDITPRIVFTTLSEARECLEMYQIKALGFLTPPKGAPECFQGWTWHPNRGPDIYSVFHGSTYSGYDPPHHAQARSHFLEILSSWEQAFQDMLSRDPHKAQIQIKECAAIWLRYLPLSIKVAVSYQSNELLYDSHLPAFEKIVEQSRILLHQEGMSGLLVAGQDVRGQSAYRQARNERFFSIDSNVLYPLYFAALKCRS